MKIVWTMDIKSYKQNKYKKLIKYIRFEYFFFIKKITKIYHLRPKNIEPSCKEKIILYPNRN